MYKYLKYAMSTYNSVMDSPIANRYYAKYENFITRNNLQKYTKDASDLEKEKAIIKNGKIYRTYHQDSP